jgi:hypothetical protein
MLHDEKPHPVRESTLDDRRQRQRRRCGENGGE